MAIGQRPIAQRQLRGNPFNNWEALRPNVFSAVEHEKSRILRDILNAVFGYDKYAELTSEHAIRGTYCDLAVRIDGKLAFLLEVKAVGLDLKDQHVKQSVDYAANQGCEWVVLTNGIEWRLLKV